MINNNEDKIIELIEKQIDRKPEGMVEVTIECPFSYPAVIKVYPFFNGRVFPTTYWLTCPYLQKKISILEDKGWITKMQKLVDNDEEVAQTLKKAHKNYAKERFKMLDSEEKAKMKEISDDIYKTLKYSGIGGVKDNKGIKCLHTHVADFLVNNFNPVGKKVFQKIKWPKTCNICKEMESNEKSSN